MTVFKSDYQLSKKQKLFLFSAIVLALILALYYVVSHLYSTDFGHDESRYINMAQQLVEKHIYGYSSEVPNAFVPPGYPLFLSFCYLIFGFSPRGLAAIRIIQTIFSVLTVYLTFVFSSKLTENNTVGIISAFLIALNINFYSYTFSFLTENLYFFLMMIFAVFFLFTARQDKLWPHFISGILFSACIMVRSAIFPIILTVYIPVFIKYKNEKKVALTRFLLFVAGFIVLALPWWVRNAVVLHEFIPFCKQDHIFFAGLAEDIYSLGYSQPNGIVGNIAVFFDLLGKDPVGTLSWATLGKFKVIFLDYGNSINELFSEFVSCITVFCGLPICIKGLFCKENRWAFITFFIYLLTVFFGVPSQRYGLQFMFFLSACAAYTFYIIFSSKGVFSKLNDNR